MKSRIEIEGELAEYLLELDAMDRRLAAIGQGLFHKCLINELRPLYLRQRALLRTEACVGADCRLELRALEEEEVAVLERCLRQLEALWQSERSTTEMGERT